MGDQSGARLHMIEGQIRPNEVTDSRIIEAFEAIPRERFVPERLRGVAYLDEDIKVAPDRYLMEPRVLARLIQAAGVSENDAVLDIGGATGYSAAILSRLAGVVVALEENTTLAKEATTLLAELQCDTAAVVENTLTKGYPKQAPYDVILINGMFDELPKPLEKQLAEGGRLIGVRMIGGVGRAILMVKSGGIISGRELFDAQISALPGFEKAEVFRF